MLELNYDLTDLTKSGRMGRSSGGSSSTPTSRRAATNRSRRKHLLGADGPRRDAVQPPADLRRTDPSFHVREAWRLAGTRRLYQLLSVSPTPREGRQVAPLAELADDSLDHVTGSPSGGARGGTGRDRYVVKNVLTRQAIRGVRRSCTFWLRSRTGRRWARSPCVSGASRPRPCDGPSDISWSTESSSSRALLLTRSTPGTSRLGVGDHCRPVSLRREELRVELARGDGYHHRRPLIDRSRSGIVRNPQPGRRRRSLAGAGPSELPARRDAGTAQRAVLRLRATSSRHAVAGDLRRLWHREHRGRRRLRHVAAGNNTLRSCTSPPTRRSC